MQCPKCKDAMQRGSLAILRSRLDPDVELLAGKPGRAVPNSAIYFELADGRSVKPRLSGEGWLCPSCDLVVLEGYDELSCFECGEPIAANADACPKCGWSWK